MTVKTSAVLFLCLGILNSCAGKKLPPPTPSDAPQPQIEPEKNETPQTQIAPQHNLGATDNSLNGLWKSACVSDNSNNSSKKYEISFQNDSYKWTNTNFDELDCLGTATTVYIWEGFYGKNSETIADAAEPSPIAFNYSLESVTLAHPSQRAVNISNNDQTCGISDWALDTPKNILGTLCLPFEKGLQSKSWFVLKNGVLQLDISAIPEERPLNLSMLALIPYTR